MSNRPIPEGYITIAQAAKYASVSHQTIRNLIKNGKLPCENRVAGTRTYHYLKEKDVKDYFRKYATKPQGRPKKSISLYEIVCISCGKMEILFRTCNLQELSRKYVHLFDKENKLIRIRADGELLTIRESDRLGLATHPRYAKLRKGALV